MRIQAPGMTFAQYKFKLAADFDPSKLGDSGKGRPLPVTDVTKVSSGYDSTAWNQAASSTSSAPVFSGLSDTQVEFKKLAEMSPAERIRYNFLKSKGLDEQALQAMPPEQRQSIEKEIAQAIKTQLGADPASQTAGSDAPINANPDSTLAPDTSAVERVSRLIETRNALDSPVV